MECIADKLSGFIGISQISLSEVDIKLPGGAYFMQKFGLFGETVTQKFRYAIIDSRKTK